MLHKQRHQEAPCNIQVLSNSYITSQTDHLQEETFSQYLTLTNIISITHVCSIAREAYSLSPILFGCVFPYAWYTQVSKNIPDYSEYKLQR